MPVSYRRHNYGLSAGWSSLVARRAHNPKVAGSNPAPATKQSPGQNVFLVGVSLVFEVGQNVKSLLVSGVYGAGFQTHNFIYTAPS